MINVRRPARRGRPCARRPNGATTMQPGAGVNLRRRTRGGRIGTVMPWGNEIVAVSATSITLRNSQYPEGRDFPSAGPYGHAAQAVKPADIKGRKWATVHRMLKPAGTLDETTSAVLVMRIDIAPGPPIARKRHQGIAVAADGGGRNRDDVGIAGRAGRFLDNAADVHGQRRDIPAANQAERQDLRTDGHPRVRHQAGETADAEFQTINLDYAIKAINIKPADEPRRTIVPRPASAHPLERH